MADLSLNISIITLNVNGLNRDWKRGFLKNDLGSSRRGAVVNESD